MNQMFVSSLIVQKKETLIGCFTTFNPKAPIGTKESDFPIKIYQFRGDNTQKEKQPTVTWDSVCFNRDGESERLAKLSDVKISEEKSMGLDQAERTASHEGWSAKRSRQLCWKKKQNKKLLQLKSADFLLDNSLVFGAQSWRSSSACVGLCVFQRHITRTL